MTIDQHALDEFNAAVAAVQDLLPGARVDVHPSGDASNDSDWAANVTITTADGREYVHAGGSWAGTDETFDEDYETFGTLIEAADVLVWGVMHQAALDLCQQLNTSGSS